MPARKTTKRASRKKPTALSNASPAAFPGLLEEMTVEELRRFKPRVVVLALGSTEPHGPHLPMGADVFQVTALARRAVQRANQRGARALLYPTLPITNNVNMRKLPFALGVGVRTLMQVLIDLIIQVRDQGVWKVVIINGHGGNPGTLDATLREIAGMDDMPFACWTYGIAPEGFKNPIVHWSDHGGEMEVSRLLAIRPELVRQDKLGNFPFGKLKVPSLAKANFVRPWHMYLPQTAGGETRLASAQKGDQVLNANANGVAQLIVELAKAKFDERFPYK